MDFGVPSDHRLKSKEIKKIEEFLDLTKERKNCRTLGDVDTNCKRRVWSGLRGIGNQRHTRNHTDRSIFKIG